MCSGNPFLIRPPIKYRDCYVNKEPLLWYFLISVTRRNYYQATYHFSHSRKFRDIIHPKCLRYIQLIRRRDALSEGNVESLQQLQKHMNAEFARDLLQNNTTYWYMSEYIKTKTIIQSMDFIHATFAAKYSAKQKVWKIIGK